MAETERHYFVYGNSAQGFRSHLASNLLGIERLYILRGRPGTGKVLMKAFENECALCGLPAEYLHCPSAPKTYDGIILPQLKLAVLDGTDLHAIRLPTPVPNARYIDTETVYDSSALEQSEQTAAELFQRIEHFHENAFINFNNALNIHDEWEKIYIENMDFLKADTLADDTFKALLGKHQLNKTALSKERFFGASTPLGACDFIESLTGSISKRFLLKGRPGTGKSTLLRKLVAESIERGLDTEIYSCAFDSNSLDMIIWPELDLCLFDSTSPHLYEPSRPNDEVIDMYEECVKPGTDEKYAAILIDITARYKQEVEKGTAQLKEAKRLSDELQTLYSGCVERDEIQLLCEAFAEQLLS